MGVGCFPKFFLSTGFNLPIGMIQVRKEVSKEEGRRGF
jgi:hypothetical protein